MIRAVLLSSEDLEPELRSTVLFRHNVERLGASTVEEVRRAATAGRVDVIVVDSQLPAAADAVAALRQDAFTRAISIVVLGRSEFGFGHLDLLEAGANAILPLPPGADWDDRLERLVHVPLRRATRLPVRIELQGGLGAAGGTLSAQTLNVSVHGLLIASRVPLRVGQDLRFAFELPESHGSVEGKGTVVRQAERGEFGVELTEVEGDGRVRLRRFVEAGQG
jgi:CheY-like chemotaxis protein